MIWTLRDRAIPDQRAVVSHMHGDRSPYQMEVSEGDKQVARFVGLPSAASCVESFVTWMRGRGVEVRIGMAWGWGKWADDIDALYVREAVYARAGSAS